MFDARDIIEARAARNQDRHGLTPRDRGTVMTTHGC